MREFFVLQRLGVLLTRPGRRLWLSLAIGIACAAASWAYWSEPRDRLSDFGQLWAGARALLRAQNPYQIVGPGREFDWQFPLLYPLPAVIAAVPFAALPLRVADALFVGLGAALLAWVLTRRSLNNPQLAVFVSLAYLHVIQTSQWAPWIVAAALTPGLAPLVACKPTLALAMLVAFPNVRVILGAGAAMAVSVIIWPWWPAEWLAALPAGAHIVAPVTRLGGPLVLLALLKWRRPEARLLAVLACVPHTPELYEAVPLFLIPLIIEEAALLSILTVVMFAVREGLRPYSSYAEWMDTSGLLMVWLLYLPCLVMILLRPNVAAKARVENDANIPLPV